MNQIVEDIINEINDAQIQKGRELMLYEMRPILEKHIAKINNAPTGDLISRSALKDVLINEYEAREHYSGEIMLKAIDDAPTVEPERPQGKWGKWIVAEIQCPTCFKYYEVDYYSAEELNKCPSCGADMQKGSAK